MPRADTARILRKFGLPIYQLLGGKVRNRIKVYSWIGGDRPSEVKEQAYVHFPVHIFYPDDATIRQN